ncbi:MAG: RNA polymerase sigma factor [Planctomycetota bacterium]
MHSENTTKADGSALDNPVIKKLSSDEFSELAVSTYAALWTLARSVVKTAEDAEDVVQEAFIIGLDKCDHFNPGTSFLAWMGTIVRLTAKNYGRRQARRAHAPLDTVAEHPAQASTPTVVNPDTGQVLDSQDSFDDDLARALDQLSPTARGCLMLRTQHDLDYEMIGQIMGVPKNTAMSHVHRARQALRDQLSQHLRQVSTERGAGQ